MSASGHKSPSEVTLPPTTEEESRAPPAATAKAPTRDPQSNAHTTPANAASARDPPQASTKPRGKKEPKSSSESDSSSDDKRKPPRRSKKSDTDSSDARPRRNKGARRARSKRSESSSDSDRRKPKSRRSKRDKFDADDLDSLDSLTWSDDSADAKRDHRRSRRDRSHDRSSRFAAKFFDEESKHKRYPWWRFFEDFCDMRHEATDNEDIKYVLRKEFDDAVEAARLGPEQMMILSYLLYADSDDRLFLANAMLRYPPEAMLRAHNWNVAWKSRKFDRRIHKRAGQEISQLTYPLFPAKTKFAEKNRALLATAAGPSGGAPTRDNRQTRTIDKIFAPLYPLCGPEVEGGEFRAPLMVDPTTGQHYVDLAPAEESDRGLNARIDQLYAAIESISALIANQRQSRAANARSTPRGAVNTSGRNSSGRAAGSFNSSGNGRGRGRGGRFQQPRGGRANQDAGRAESASRAPSSRDDANSEQDF